MSKGTPATQAVTTAGIPYRLLEYTYDPSADAIGLQAAEALGLDPAMVFKTLIVELGSGELICVLIPVATRLNLKQIAALAGARNAVLADPQKAERTTGYVVGGISPLCQRKPLRTFLDASAEMRPEIVVNGGRRGLQIVLSPQDLANLLEATIAPITSK